MYVSITARKEHSYYTVIGEVDGTPSNKEIVAFFHSKNPFLDSLINNIIDITRYEIAKGNTQDEVLRRDKSFETFFPDEA